MVNLLKNIYSSTIFLTVKEEHSLSKQVPLGARWRFNIGVVLKGKSHFSFFPHREINKNTSADAMDHPDGPVF